MKHYAKWFAIVFLVLCFFFSCTQVRKNTITGHIEGLQAFVKEKGLDNNLLELIAADPAFNLSLEELQKTMDPAKYVGRAPVQVEAYLNNVVNPMLEANKEILGVTAEINV